MIAAVVLAVANVLGEISFDVPKAEPAEVCAEHPFGGRLAVQFPLFQDDGREAADFRRMQHLLV